MECKKSVAHYELPKILTQTFHKPAALGGVSVAGMDAVFRPLSSRGKSAIISDLKPAGMDAVFRPLSSLGTDGSQFAGSWLAAR